MVRPVTTPPGIDPGLTGFSVPVARPVGAVSNNAVAAHTPNIRSHTELRSVPNPVIPMIDNSGGGYKVVNTITVASEQAAPTYMPGEQPMLMPGEQAQKVAQVQNPWAQPAVAAPTGGSLLGLFSATATPAVSPAPAAVMPYSVRFSVGNAQGSEDVMSAFGDVDVHEDLLVFVNPVGPPDADPWFPEDIPAGYQVAVKVEGTNTVYLVVASAFKFDYAGARFKFAKIERTVTV